MRHNLPMPMPNPAVQRWRSPAVLRIKSVVFAGAGVAVALVFFPPWFAIPVAAVLAAQTDESLNTSTTPVEAPGWPLPGSSYPVRTCLRVVLNEEWCHRQFAERDLAVLEARAAQS